MRNIETHFFAVEKKIYSVLAPTLLLIFEQPFLSLLGFNFEIIENIANCRNIGNCTGKNDKIEESQKRVNLIFVDGMRSANNFLNFMVSLIVNGISQFDFFFFRNVYNVFNNYAWFSICVRQRFKTDCFYIGKSFFVNLTVFSIDVKEIEIRKFPGFFFPRRVTFCAGLIYDGFKQGRFSCSGPSNPKKLLK